MKRSDPGQLCRAREISERTTLHPGYACWLELLLLNSVA